MSWRYVCDRALATDDRLIFPWAREGLLLRAKWADGTELSQFFDGAPDGRIQPSISVKLEELLPAPPLEVAARYLNFGFDHLMTGWDHLAFLALLALLARGWALVCLVTAFTVGHSITLAIVSLNSVDLPMAPIEACIALSIVFAAREIVVATRTGHIQRRVHWFMPLVFGLLHGLGFASVLIGANIDGPSLLIGLSAFNLGIELGQIAFVLGLSAVLACLSRIRFSLDTLRKVLAFGLGSLGMFWTFQRVAGFG